MRAFSPHARAVLRFGNLKGNDDADVLLRSVLEHEGKYGRRDLFCSRWILLGRVPESVVAVTTGLVEPSGP
jgi:hypothetical protein